MAGFFDSLIRPNIIEIITYRIIEQTRTFTVVTVPNKRVIPCSFKNSKYVNAIPLDYQKNQATLKLPGLIS